MQGLYEELDYLWFYYIHFEWSNAFFDAVLPYLRNQFFWAPLYLFLLIYIFINYRIQRAILWCAGYLVTFGIGDFISSKLIKPYFARVRPCREEALEDIIRNIVHCGGGYSFPSSHAVNHFAMAMFIAITLGGGKRKWIWPLCIFWAAIVSYSQVYVGVHYPFDVIAGGILGIIIGTVIGLLFVIFMRNNYRKISNLMENG